MKAGGLAHFTALTPAGRDAWVLAQRPPTPRSFDPYRVHHVLVEREPDATGAAVEIATLFLRNRECPWRCLMCDLWQETTEEAVPPGAIQAQVSAALATLAPARWIKLYNSGSFFDPRAIRVEEYPAIATQLGAFERVIVESHPLLVGGRTWQWEQMLSGQLEVAMGLETVHPRLGPLLNKRVTLEQFRAAAQRLMNHEVVLRVFVLAILPGQTEDEAREWTLRSVSEAFDCGADVVSIIPTRMGNGALDQLAELGEFREPSLELLEREFADALALQRGRVLLDLWDLPRFSRCTRCFAERLARLQQMFLQQVVLPSMQCPACACTP